MTLKTLCDVELAAFVAASAAMLGLQLDERAQREVLEAMRGLMLQAIMVLNSSNPSVTT